MSLLPDLAASVATNELALVIGPSAERLPMLELSAALALRGAVRILDGGNSYNALYVARYIRRHTVQLDETLNRITVARAFTCYQMVALMQETAASASSTSLSRSEFARNAVKWQAVSPTPTLVLDLLVTFGDESIDLGERVRLLRLAIAALHRLCRLGPVVVSIRPFPPHQANRGVLAELVMNAAVHLFVREPPETAVHQLPLDEF